MPDPLRAQLGAYLDNELDGAARRTLEAHLQTCEACRAELAELRRLSAALNAAPLPSSLPTAEAFASQLGERLPARHNPRPALPAGQLAWFGAAGLLGGLAVLQAGAVLTALLTLLENASLFPPGWLAGSLPQSLWLGAAAFFLPTLPGLPVGGGLLDTLLGWLGPFAWQSAVTLAYLVGLAAWWSSSFSSYAAPALAGSAAVKES